MSFTSIKWDQHAITKPGVYTGIPLDLYHDASICEGASISSSGMRTIFNESPADFYVDWAGNPDRPTGKEKRHFSVGRAVHHLMLGEKFFAGLFVEEPPEYVSEDKKSPGELKPWNNNAIPCKRWQQEQKDLGRSVLKAEDVTNIRGMCEELARNPMVQHGLLNGAIERSIFWKDKETGIWIKSRPDTIPGDGGMIVDLKTTDSVQWTDLIRSIGAFGYHQQGALVCRAAREVLGIKQPEFALVFVQKKPPYSVRVVMLKPEDLARGDRQNRLATKIFADCLKANRWPGPGGDREDAEYIELGPFDQKRIDEKLEMAGVKS